MPRNSSTGNRLPSARPAASPARKRPSSGRITGSLIAVSSAAIVSVYAAGYMNTQAAPGSNASGLAMAPQDTSVPQSAVSNSAGPAAQQPSAPFSQSANSASRAQATNPTPTPAGAGSNATSSALKDGSYTGMGSSRHGSIQATVVVNGGKIVSANVTGCGTRYPCSKVTPLVSQVVSRQSAPVNYVSGATDSSMAYIQAVRSALVQAGAA